LIIPDKDYFVVHTKLDIYVLISIIIIHFSFDIQTKGKLKMFYISRINLFQHIE